MLNLEPIKKRLSVVNTTSKLTWYTMQRAGGGRDFMRGGDRIGQMYDLNDAELVENAPYDLAALIAEIERLRVVEAIDKAALSVLAPKALEAERLQEKLEELTVEVIKNVES